MLVQIAVKTAGIRKYSADERYCMLLRNYKKPNGSPVTSCKQLNNSQLEDILAICEANGWRMPGKTEDFYRQKVAAGYDYASYAQQSAIKYLAGDLGWNEYQLGGMLERMTGGKIVAVEFLEPREAYKIIEALKAMLERKTGKRYNSLSEIENEMESSRISDKNTECEISALNGLRDGKEAEYDSTQSR